MPNWESYIKTVVGEVKLPFDRTAIAKELRNHLVDSFDDLCSVGVSEETAFQQAMDQMGDAKTLGKALNEVHHPVIGWIWYASRLCFIFFLCITIVPVLIYSISFFTSVFGSYDDDYRERVSAVAYTMDLEEKVRFYDSILIVDELIYYENGVMELRYRSYQKPFTRSMAWSFSLSDISDEKGTYYPSSGFGTGGYYRHYQEKVTDFSLENEVLRLRYGVDLWLEIPLQWEVAT